MRTDIAIFRLAPGFYSISSATTKGRAFMRNVQDADVRGNAYSDDTRMTADIAEGAVRDGLNVTLNGKQLRLKGQR